MRRIHQSHINPIPLHFHFIPAASDRKEIIQHHNPHHTSCGYHHLEPLSCHLHTPFSEPLPTNRVHSEPPVNRYHLANTLETSQLSLGTMLNRNERTETGVCVCVYAPAAREETRKLLGMCVFVTESRVEGEELGSPMEVREIPRFELRDWKPYSTNEGIILLS